MSLRISLRTLQSNWGPRGDGALEVHFIYKIKKILEIFVTSWISPLFEPKGVVGPLFSESLDQPLVQDNSKRYLRCDRKSRLYTLKDRRIRPHILIQVVNM